MPHGVLSPVLASRFVRSAALLAFVAGCGGGGGGTNGGGPGGSTACTLDDATARSGRASPSGCDILLRDTSACDGSRMAQGLSGVWLRFSCRVTLTSTPAGVVAQADGRPDYRTPYFPATDPCHLEVTGGSLNPNTIATQSLSITFPASPDTASQAMQGAIVGLALNGVPIFGNFAAPGDDIFAEAATFDFCGAHPQAQGKYHYHSEPYAITYDDSNLVGVMRDGYPIYGRRDPDGSVPADLDAFGGHTGFTPDSPAVAVYHYHLNEQTSTNPGTLGQKQWFLTTGTYRGTPGACTGCN